MKDSAAIALIIFLCALVVLMVYQGDRMIKDEVSRRRLLEEMKIVNSHVTMTWCRKCNFAGYNTEFKNGYCPRCGQ